MKITLAAFQCNDVLRAHGDGPFVLSVPSTQKDRPRVSPNDIGTVPVCCISVIALVQQGKSQRALPHRQVFLAIFFVGSKSIILDILQKSTHKIRYYSFGFDQSSFLHYEKDGINLATVLDQGLEYRHAFLHRPNKSFHPNRTSIRHQAPSHSRSLRVVLLQ